MKKRLLKKEIIKGMFPLVMAIVLISASFQACEKDEILLNTDSETESNQSNLLKSASISAGDIDAMITKIQNFIADGALESGLANAFTVKLENAKKSLEKGNEQASTNQLQALMNQVKGLLEAGTIETSIGEGLIYELRLLAGETPTFTDPRDNHEYKTMKIGDQVWMAENLAYLPIIFRCSWNNRYSDYSPRYFVYDYNGSGTIDDYDFSVEGAKATENYATYGVLYNWPAASIASPEGWHLPSDAEWQQLADYLKDNGYGYIEDGSGIAKALAATSGWNVSDPEGTPGNDMLSNNSSGFSGLPGGLCYTATPYYTPGYFHGMGKYCIWWSNSTYVDNWEYGVTRHLKNTEPWLISSSDIKGMAFSVRCVRD